MSGPTLAAVLIVVFAAGAYGALVVRAWIEERARLRIDEAAQSALSPESLARLREYIAQIDDHERDRIHRLA